MQRSLAAALLAILGLAAPVLSMANVDLVVNHNDTPDPVAAGGIVTHDIRVTNNAFVDTATGVSVAHTIPANASYQGFSGAGVSCSGMAVGQAGAGTVTCTLPNLVANGGEIIYNLLVGTNVSGFTVVGAVASSTETDDIPGNNSDPETTTVNAGANLALSKTPSSGSAPAGGTHSWNLTVSNAGPDAATSVRVTDPIPTGFLVSSIPAGCSSNGSTITCDIAGPIASGGSFVIGAVSGQISVGSGSTVTNSASVAVVSPSAPQDPNTGNNTAVANVSVTAGSDLAISKSRSVGGNLLIGQSFNFVLTPTYTGDSPNSVTVTDNVPANYTISALAASQNGWTCGRSGQVVTCTRPAGGVAGANQALGSITIPVTVASAGSNIANTASISAATPTDPNPANNTASDGGVNLLTPTVDLGIGKSGPSPPLVVAGVPFDYSVTASNSGNTAYFGTLTLTDNLPSGLTVNSYTLNGWSCSPAAPVVGPATINCSRIYTAGTPLAAAGTTPALVLNATATTTGAINNNATVTATSCNLAGGCGDGDNSSYVVTAAIGAQSADIRLLKTVDLATVPAGDVLTYTLEVVNDGPITSTNVALSDVFDTLLNNSVAATGAGYVGQSIAAGVATGASCSNSASGGNGRALSCSFAAIPVCTAGVDCPKVIVQVRPGGDGGSRTNTANVVSNGTPDPNHANETASATNTVDPRADITVTKNVSPATIAAGQNLTYVIATPNNGPSRADNVTISDTLPLGVTFVSAAPASGSCSTTPGANVTTTGGNRTLVCNLGAVSNGAQSTVTVVVRPNNATRGTSITNNVSVSTSTVELNPPGNSNNSASVNANVSVPTLDLNINKTDSVDPVAVGDTTTYTITVTNSGPSSSENVQVTDTLPVAGLSFQAASSSVGSCPTQPAVNAIGGAVICNLGYMPANTTQTVSVTMRGETKGVRTNNATVASDESALGFESTGNNSVAENTTVRTKADVQVVSKIPSAATVNLRDDFSFVVKVRNNSGAGLSEADDVIVSDTLPTNMELTGPPTIALVAGSTTISTCTGTAGGTSFSCSLGTLSSGGEVDITLPVQLIAVTTNPQTFNNTASVVTSSFDTVPANNSNSGSVSVNSSSLAGRVYRDFNNDGLITGGDTGISGITMTLTGTSFDGVTITRTATTDSNGNYNFANVPQGTYSVSEGAVAETQLNDGIDTVGSAGGTLGADTVTAISLPSNSAATGYNFAEVPIARIGLAKAAAAPVTSNTDGSVTTTFTLRVRNPSLETLNNVTVTDVLNGAAPSFGSFVAGGAAATLANGQYTIQTAPAFSGACTNGSVNASFDGSGTTSVATISALAPSVQCIVAFSIRLRTTVPQPAGTPPYQNQASTTGTGALSGQTPTDLSDNGTNTDADGDGQPNEAGENDVTPVTPVYRTTIGIAKRVGPGAQVINADSSITTPFELVITNTSNEPLHTIVVADTLSGAVPAFGTYVAGTPAAGQYTVTVVPAFSGACSNGSANASYTGTGGQTTVATLTNMAIAQSCTLTFSLRFMPQSSSGYTNQATISGTGDYTNVSANDLSDNGTNPDADGDFTPNEAGENDPTPVPWPRVGLAKQLNGSTTINVDGTVVVPFRLRAANIGGEVLNTVVISDDVSGVSPQFGSFVAGGAGATLIAGQYTIQSAPAFSGACTGGSANAAYTGDASQTVATIPSLAVAASCVVDFSLRFRPLAPLPVGGYLNSSSVTGTGAVSALVTNDTSDNGAVVDADGDGIANEAGENDPTVVSITFTPRLGVAKSKPAVEVINGNGTVTVAFRVRAQNMGTEPLIAITLNDVLEGAAPRFGSFVTGGAAASLANSQYTVEAAPTINGVCAAATLTAGYTGATGGTQLASLTRLEVGTACEFNFTLRYRPTSPLPVGGYSNQATAAATGEFLGTATSDQSQNGINPDPNGNGDPTDDNVPTPVNSTHTPAIGVAKALQSGLIVNGNGSYTGTFRVRVQNLGNEDLDNVVVSDVLAGVAPRFGAFVAGGASAALGAGQYTIATAPSLVGSCATGSGNGGFNGDTTTTLASITLLPVSSDCSFDVALRFAPQPGASYNNQATATGTGSFSAGAVTDSSDNGATPDSNGDGNANQPGENDPTPVPIPRIGVAKSAGAVSNNGDGTYNVSFTLRVDNAGETSLATAQLNDTLTSQFGAYTASAVPAAGQYTIVSGPTITSQSNGANLSAVAAGVYTGSGAGSALLNAAASSLPNFGVGTASSAQLQFTLRFFPTTPGPFNNSAIATGISPAGGNVTDASVNGALPDANGNGDPGDDTSPTVISLAGQVIGVTKSVAAIVQTGVRRFQIPYAFIVSNPSTTVTATNVQLSDSLNAAFPTASSLQITTPVAVSACTGTVLTVASPVYSGTGQNNLLTGNQNLQPGERCTVRFTVQVDFGANALPTVPQNNQATASTAQSPNGTAIASDLSDNSVNPPDPDGNQNANEPGENDPTPVNFAPAGLSSVSGNVYLDANHDRVSNDPPASARVQGFIVEVLNAAGVVVGTTTTDASGNYTIGSLFPSTPSVAATTYSVRFREPGSGAIYGIPQSQDPTAARNGVIDNGVITGLQLAAAITTLAQNLPLDPSGVIYDSITRAPVSGAQVTLTNGGTAVPTGCLVGGINTQTTGASGQYQFLLINPAPPACPGNGTYTIQVVQPGAYLPPASVIIPAPAGPLTPTNGGVQVIQTQAGPPTGANPTTYYFGFTLTLGVSANVVGNNIPLDPVLGGAIALTKTTPLVNVSVGQIVPYTITARNTLAARLTNIDVNDTTPPGFKYRVGSATVDGVAVEPAVSNRVLTWSNLIFLPNQTRTIKLLLIVGAGVQPNEYVNTAQASNNLVPPPNSNAVSNVATATVRVVPEPVFDCSDLIGKVFDDQNANGYQDSGEPGIPNVRMATARGWLVTSDADGRFHVACAAIPDADHGSNFIMKLDERTLPTGYRLTTENPRDVRVTRGKLTRLNFGATIHKVVRLDLSDAAFAPAQTELTAPWAAQLAELPAALKARPSVLRIGYTVGADGAALARQRLAAISAQLQDTWQQHKCCDRLLIEEELFLPAVATGSEGK